MFQCAGSTPVLTNEMEQRLRQHHRGVCRFGCFLSMVVVALLHKSDISVKASHSQSLLFLNGQICKRMRASANFTPTFCSFLMKWQHRAFKLMSETGQKKKNRPQSCWTEETCEMLHTSVCLQQHWQFSFHGKCDYFGRRMTCCSDVLLTVNIAGSYGRHSKQLLVFCKNLSRITEEHSEMVQCKQRERVHLALLYSSWSIYFIACK